MDRINVAVDAMGGDNAPGAIVEGAIDALREYPDLRVTLFGAAETLTALTAAAADVADRLAIVHAPDVIEMDESPVIQVRKKTESSMVKAMLAVKNQEADAFLSAGSTGAIMAGGMLRVGRIKGIERPALAVVIPGRKKPFMLIDAGANVDCQPAYLTQFSLMGSIYMNRVFDIREPKVGLVNIGAEAEKGNRLTKETYQMMAAQTAFRFGGNIEARDIPTAGFDVVAADGFDGNIILKYTEGLSGALIGMLKDQMLSSLRAKIGALLLKPALRNFKNGMSYEEYGGAPLLGVEGVMIKAHGSSNAKAIKNALRQARKMVQGNIPQVIRQGLEALTPAQDESAEQSN